MISINLPRSSTATTFGTWFAHNIVEVRVGHLVGAGQVEPDLEQLERIRFDLVEQREHLGMRRCPRRPSSTARRRPRSGPSRRANRQ